MESYKEKAYKAFEMFDKEWAIVTAGDLEHYNSCTIGWGSFGNSWRDEGNKCSTITIYVHPTRYTSEFLKDNDYFTVSFYPKNIDQHLHILVLIRVEMKIKQKLQV